MFEKLVHFTMEAGKVGHVSGVLGTQKRRAEAQQWRRQNKTPPEKELYTDSALRKLQKQPSCGKINFSGANERSQSSRKDQLVSFKSPRWRKMTQDHGVLLKNLYSSWIWEIIHSHASFIWPTWVPTAWQKKQKQNKNKQCIWRTKKTQSSLRQGRGDGDKNDSEL